MTGHKSPWLTKTRFMSGRQCRKRLWYEVNAPLAEGLPESMALLWGRAFDQVVQTLEPGVVISRENGLPAAIESTTARLAEGAEGVLYQPAFRRGRFAVIADVLRRRSRSSYDLVEVKSSTKVKDEHLPDVAFQAMVLRGADIPVKRAFIGHVDNTFVLRRKGDYRGLMVESDVTEEVDELQEEVGQSAEQLLRVMTRKSAPAIAMDAHCRSPYECPFISRCTREAGGAIDYPIDLLPKGGAIVEELRAEGYADLREVPAGRLSSPIHRRVHEATVTGRACFDPSEALHLAGLKGPKAYLDFETIASSVPEIVGTRPYEQLPFQWSLHVEDSKRRLTHADYLAVGNFGDFADLASALLRAIPPRGPVFAYNAAFEKRVLTALAGWLPRHAAALRKLSTRLVDLLPVTRQAYYHRDMRGSWSIKAVLSTISPELRYETLGEVREGEAAQLAFLELRKTDVAAKRREELTQALREYCRRDTLGMVVLRRFLCEET
jgi:hypothetical protein